MEVCVILQLSANSVLAFRTAATTPAVPAERLHHCISADCHRPASDSGNHGTAHVPSGRDAHCLLATTTTTATSAAAVVLGEPDGDTDHVDAGRTANGRRLCRRRSTTTSTAEPKGPEVSAASRLGISGDLLIQRPRQTISAVFVVRRAFADTAQCRLRRVSSSAYPASVPCRRRSHASGAGVQLNLWVRAQRTCSLFYAACL